VTGFKDCWKCQEEKWGREGHQVEEKNIPRAVKFGQQQKYESQV
jgi:hypothetical protein